MLRLVLCSLGLVTFVTACNIYNDDLLARGLKPTLSQDNGGSPDDVFEQGTGGRDNQGGAGPGEPASGGTGGSGNSGMADGGSAGAPANPGVDHELIDDMEDNDPNVLLTGGRNGRWNVYNDGSGSQFPAPDFSSMADVGVPRASSNYAAYTRGEGFSGFGAVLNVTMRSWPDYEETPPYDASEYSGVSFFARAGPDAKTNIHVRLVTTDTDPRGAVCQAEGAVSELCFDHFSLQVALSEEWARFDLEFDEFTQTGAGRQFVSPAMGGLYAIEFLSPGPGAFEFWVDDLAFLLQD